jgi:hypothetical protein
MWLFIGFYSVPLFSHFLLPNGFDPIVILSVFMPRI